MSRLTTLGKWLFATPFAVFGLLHFGPAEFSLPYVPDWLPFPLFWVWVAGAGMLLFFLAVLLKRCDRMAARLLALELLLFVGLIHVPAALGGDFTGVIAIFRDTAMAGAALLFAHYATHDKLTQ